MPQEQVYKNNFAILDSKRNFLEQNYFSKYSI
jgi:hypothetical protein